MDKKKRFKPSQKIKKGNSSWEAVSTWYDSCVGKEGHYYHKTVILPALKRLIPLSEKESVLDLGCGQGILEKQIPKKVRYVGLDLSKSLLKAAEKSKRSNQHEFHLQDLSLPFSLDESFDHALFLLSLQNIKDPKVALCSAKKHLNPSGTLHLVLNHPCFRIPRQSHWGFDDKKKVQYRRMDRYSSRLEIPIQSNPSLGTQSELSFSYHYSLEELMAILSDQGLGVTKLEEWHSLKESSGSRAKAENRSRREFPLFLYLQAKSF